MKQIIKVSPVNGFKAMASEVVFKVVPKWYGASRDALTMTVVYKRDQKPRPTLVWISGGAWQQVDSCVYLPEQLYLMDRGYNVAAINYRNSNAALFPAQIEDLKAGIRYLRAHAEEFGIDKDRIAAMGESAGGHLALMVGVTGNIRDYDVGDNLDQSSAVNCAVSWYGPTDFAALGEGRSDEPTSPECLLYGATAEKDPEACRKASPISYVDENTPPIMMIHGNADQLVPLEQSELMYQALEKAGVETEFYVVEGANHGDPMFASPEVQSLIAAFLDKHLKA